MPNLLLRGAAFLAGKMKANCSVTISITRQGFTTTGVSATLGSQLLRTTTGDGMVKTERTDRDFSIQTADYQVNGAVTLPMKGDLLVVTDGATDLLGQLFRVLPIDSEKEWRYSDEFGLVLRVHTKHAGPA